MEKENTLKGYLSLCRISNLPSIWTNVLCAFMLANSTFVWPQYLLAALSLSCFYLAGMCLNDICDLSHDRIKQPTRPLPAGLVSLAGAWFLTVLLLVMAFCLLLLLPCRQGTAAGILLAVVIVCYDLRHKKNPLSVLLMATCRFLVFVVTALAVTGQVVVPVLAAGGVQFMYVVGVSLAARHENARPIPHKYPLIPWLLAGIPVLDGIVMAVMLQPAWLLAGCGGLVLQLAGQRFVRGD